MEKRVPLTWENPGLHTKQRLDSKIMKRKEYSNLPRNTLIKIFQIYRLDFELFGYDFDEVLRLAGQPPLQPHELLQ